MSTNQPSVDQLAAALPAAAPTLGSAEQRLVVGLYRALAEGAAMSPVTLAARRAWPALVGDAVR